MKKDIFIKLSTKIIIFILIILIIFMLITSFIMKNFISHVLIDSAEKRITETAGLFAQINRLPFERTDYYSLENNTKELLKQEDIIFAAIYDLSGFKLTVSEPKETDLKEKYKLYAVKDIFDKYNNKIGSLKIGISVKNTYKSINKTQLVIFIIIGITIIVSTLTLLIVIKTIINRPLNSLLESFKKVANGDLLHKSTIHAHDEIGKLSYNFNIMTSKLKKSLMLTKKIVESMPSMLIAIDEISNVTQWNQETVIYTGIKAENIIGKDLWENSIHFSDYKKYYNEILLNGKSIELYRVTLKDDATRLKNISLFPIIEDGIKGMVIRIDDITDLENKEIQLRQAQKMETIGNLAGGLAHDFNNVLGGIIGTISIIKFNMKKNANIQLDALEKYISIIDKSANRATEMVQHLLAISKKHNLNFVTTNLTDSINNVINICRSTLSKRIELSVSLLDQNAIVEANPTQLEQVILNLCINAEHAMTIMREKKQSKNNILSISLKKIFADPIFCLRHTKAKKNYYWIVSVRDSGVGIEDNIKEKIFDPFFSTKRKEKGTGLGLSMVYNIISEHGGFIDVYSKVGEGTDFKIYLPESTAEAEKPLITTANNIVHNGSGIILVIDDEKIMRELAKEILTEFGYQVKLAKNGEVGLKVYMKDQDQIKMILLDLAMPKLSGIETYHKLKELNSHVKVLMTSGFGKDKRIEKAIKLGINGFIQKPFTIQELIEKISGII